MGLIRRVVAIAITVAMATVGLALTGGGAGAAGLRHDYVKTSDGATTTVTGYDTTRSGPGVFVYDSGWGSSTQQNQWGSEAVVENGVVTTLTVPGVGGNAPIPADGFTLSGFGTGAAWITDHLQVGQPVTIDKDVILQTSVTTTTALTTINPQPPYEFPGGRGANQILAYTDAYASPTTGTNQYGTEAITVADGTSYRVASVGGNNSTIPHGGLVISGHGTMQNWIQQNLIVGTSLNLDQKNLTLSATTDATSYIFQASEAVKTAQTALATAKASYADARLGHSDSTLRTARNQLAAAKKAHQAGDDILAINTSDTATQTAAVARQLTIESRTVETRAVWHRPAEANANEVEATVKAMREAGINQLYLESFWGGRTIYPTTLAEQNSHFLGWDPLKAYVAACKRHGIQLHLWMHTFYVGTDTGDGSGNGSPVAQDHPDWLVVDKAGRTRSTTEPGYYFLDPAVPAARAWLIKLFTQAVHDYTVAGLQLDYIRYPKLGGPDTVTLTTPSREPPTTNGTASTQPTCHPATRCTRPGSTGRPSR